MALVRERTIPTEQPPPVGLDTQSQKHTHVYVGMESEKDVQMIQKSPKYDDPACSYITNGCTV
jgi:hypothetical protein